MLTKVNGEPTNLTSLQIHRVFVHDPSADIAKLLQFIKDRLSNLLSSIVGHHRCSHGAVQADVVIAECLGHGRVIGAVIGPAGRVGSQNQVVPGSVLISRENCLFLFDQLVQVISPASVVSHGKDRKIGFVVTVLEIFTEIRADDGVVAVGQTILRVIVDVVLNGLLVDTCEGHLGKGSRHVPGIILHRHIGACSLKKDLQLCRITVCLVRIILHVAVAADTDGGVAGLLILCVRCG